METIVEPSMAREMGCPSCATLMADEQWRALPLVRVMGAEDVAPFVTQWKARVIEVRRCTSCGRRIARIVPPRMPVR
jgi:hypothetical protein